MFFRRSYTSNNHANEYSSKLNFPIVRDNISNLANGFHNAISTLPFSMRKIFKKCAKEEIPMAYEIVFV